MRRTVPVLGALALAAAATLLPGAPASADHLKVVELPVAFSVKNTNTTPVPCLSDGLDYTVKGHIVAPAAALDAPRAATLYLHAVTWGEYYWRLKGVAGYDYASNMAEKGHVSVTIDRIGYGASGRPDGNGGTCFGSEADVAHQIVQALKGGSYSVTGHAPAAFKKVFVAGSSVGGMTAEIESYSFHDSDGIINFGWGEYRITDYAFKEYNELMARCAKGGDTGAPPNYGTFAVSTIQKFYFNSATPDVRASTPRANPDPCSQARSIPPGIMTDMKNIGTIDVPVLSIFGDADAIFDQSAAKEQGGRYTGSPDSTLVMVPEASHYPLVEKNHLDAEAAVDKFLSKYSG